MASDCCLLKLADMSKVTFLFEIDPAAHELALARFDSTVRLFEAVKKSAGVAHRAFDELSDEERAVVESLKCVADEFASLEPLFVRPEPRGGRVTFKLFDSEAPLAVKNFVGLVRGDSALREKRLSFVGSRVHRVVAGSLFQAGDFVKHDGSAGASIFAKGAPFKDDKGGLALKHKRGTLSMANSGKNSNTSQFFVCAKEQPQLDGHHVVFGEVLSGQSVVDEICGLGASADGPPALPVVIKASAVE